MYYLNIKSYMDSTIDVLFFILLTEYTNFVASGPLNNDWKYETKSLLFGENTQAQKVISQECHFTFEAR